jgi:hypothetical protein
MPALEVPVDGLGSGVEALVLELLSDQDDLVLDVGTECLGGGPRSA